MTYDASEKSKQGGKPIELYRFTRGLKIWTYTTADMAITFNGEIYTPQTMRRGQLPQNNEQDNSTMDLYMDPEIDVVALFVSGATPSPTNLTLIRRHRDEAVTTEQGVIFDGQIGAVEFTESQAHFVCVPIQRGLQRKIPRWVYQTICNHMLYDQFCTVNPALYTFAGHISAIVGRTLTVPEAAAKVDGYYNGGYIKDGDSFAFIQTHVGTQILLLAIPASILVGDNISTTAGCDRRQATCVGKFANLDNFMGWPFIPDKNPYSTSLNG
jgi:uncharacterized phage protein (TIGR02218 family)